MSGDTARTVMEIHFPPMPGSSSLGERIHALSELVMRGYDKDPDIGLAGAFGYGADFENDVFLMHPDYQDAECECGHRGRADEWHEEHKHAGHCYSVTIRRYERAWEKQNKERKYRCDGSRKVAQRLCAERGIPWNDGWGSAVHCDCGVKQLADAWFAENDHDFRCPHRVPNLWHKRSGIEIKWYKSIGRDMTILPKDTDKESLNTALQECFASIPEDIHTKARDSALKDEAAEIERAKLPPFDWFAAFERMYAAESPCWNCSDRASRGMRTGGGSFSYGGGIAIARTLRNEGGGCTSCGMVTTEKQAARLKIREDHQHADCRWRPEPPQ